MSDAATQPLTVYLAAPLFTQAERRWNREVADALAAELPCTVVLPQDFCTAAAETHPAHFGELFSQCLEGVDRCDVVVAVLDGPDGDAGTAFEMGYAYALGKPIVGLRTDFRKQQERGVNLMLSRGCHAFVHLPNSNEHLDEVIPELARAVIETARSCLQKPI